MQRARSMSAAATSEGASFRVPARYRFQKHLGSGSYGVVASFHDHERGRDVAIKRVKKVMDNYLVLRRTLREIRLMSHFRHPNLMRLHKVLPLDATSGGDLYISIELMDCDLDTLVHTKRVVLTDQQVRCFTAQILLGLMAMHAGHVIHRDLKPANIFVRLNRGQVKIGDLGLSRGIAVNDQTGEATHPIEECLTEYVVTRWYRAPEVLLARSKYGPPVDVWSVGCIVYEMCSRKALFAGKNSYDQLKRILGVLGGPNEADTSWVPRESMPLLKKCYEPGSSSHRGNSLPSMCSAVCSSDGVDLLQQMCLFNPSQRIGVEQALMHPYLAGITSEQDRKTAKAVDPADVTYDKMFDGVGRAGESAALVQLGRLLKREVAKFNPMRTDTTPERSQVDRTPRKDQATSRTPRGGPQSTAEAIAAAVVGGGSARGSSSGTKVISSLTEQHLAALESSDRSSLANPHSNPQPELTASVWHRRRSEPEVDVWARRSGQGVVGPPSRVASTSSVPTALSGRRRSADDGRPTVVDERRPFQRTMPGEEPPSTKSPLSLPSAPPATVPPAFWMEDKSPSKPQRGASRTDCSASALSLRRRMPACGGSATTASTRATPPGSRPGTEASTRASSRFTSTSRPRVPSVGPQSGWAAEPEGLHSASARHGDATTVSPRSGQPAVLQSELHRQQEESHLSSRRHNCWLGPEDLQDSSKSARNNNDSILVDRASARSLRESASTSNNPGLPPDLTNVVRPESHSLASLDDVLREMKAMIRSQPGDGNNESSVREDQKAQERSRPSPFASKISTTVSRPALRSSRSSTGLRGHRAAAVGRGADTSTDDRSPSAQRASYRRQPSQRADRGEHRAPSLGRQRSHDELDFAVSEPFGALGMHTPHRGGQAAEAPTPPWAESARKPLQALEPEEANSPDRGPPPMPWAQGGSVRTLQDGDQDWKSLQSNWNSALLNGSGKMQGPGGHSQLSRSGSSAKRGPTSENHISGLGFIF